MPGQTIKRKKEPRGERGLSVLDLIHDWRRPDEILQVLLPALKQTFLAREVEVYWLDASTGEIVEMAYMVTHTGANWMKIQARYPLGKGLAGWIAQHDQSIRIGDPADDPRSISRPGVFKHFLGVPMHAHAKVVGVIDMVRLVDTPFSDADEASLQQIADQLGDQLLASNQVDGLLDPATWERTEFISDFQWCATIRNGKISHRIYTPGISRLTGYPRIDYSHDSNLWFNLVLPEDRERVLAAHARLLQGDTLEEEYRIRARDGSLRWVRESARAWYQYGMLWQIDGFVSDITSRRAAETDRDRLLEALTQNLVRWQTVQSIATTLDSLDLNQTLLTIRNALVEQARFDRAGILLIDEKDPDYLVGTWGTSFDGKLLDERDYRTPLREHPRLLPVVRGEVPYVLRHTVRRQIPEPPGTSPAIKQHAIVPLKLNEHIIGLISVDNLFTQRTIALEDIPFLQLTANHVATAIAKARAFEHERQARSEAEEAQRRLTFLAEASVLLASSLDYQVTLTRIAHLAVPYLADWCAIHLSEADGSVHRMAMVHADPAKSTLIQDLLQRYPSPPNAQAGYMKVLRTGKPDFWPAIPDAMIETSAIDPDHLALMRAIGYRSYMCVPLAARGRILGAMTFVYGDTGRHYTQSDLQLAEELAVRAAIAVDNAQLYSQAQRAIEDATAARNQIEQLALTLSRHASELDAIIDAIPDGVYVCDTAGHITRANAPAGQILGITLGQDMLGSAKYSPLCEARGLDERLLAPGDLPLSRALQGETATNMRSIAYRRDIDRTIYLRTSYAPIRNAAGAITGAVAVASDVTELHQLEQQKDAFLSVASHELKTPLTSMKGFTQMAIRRLQRAGLSTEAETLTIVDQQINRLNELVNDLLDVNRIQTGRLSLEMQSFDFAALVRRTVEIMQATSDRHRWQISLPAELEIWGDPNRLEQVLTNLLSNAIKYSPTGGVIEVRLERRGDEAYLNVRDEGIGIPAKDREAIFGRFQRASNVSEQKIPGFGLGLYITSEIVRIHHGRIWLADPDELADSNQQGSSFFVALPLRSPGG